MHICLVTQVRLLEEAVTQALTAHDGAVRVSRAAGLPALRDLVGKGPPLRLIIVDTTQPVDLDGVRGFHRDHPAVPLMALGLREDDSEVIAHASAGFTFYVRREDGLAALCSAVSDAFAGRLACSPEISAAMMRALFNREPAHAPEPDTPLTPRENQIAALISDGYTNKEIAREFGLSESTVKHHVHAILAKSGVSSRLQLMRLARRGIAA